MMKSRLRVAFSLIFVAVLAAACGGGGGSDGAGSGSGQVNIPQEVGAPRATGNTAADGFAWINYRRAGAGMPQMANSSEIAKAAQNHSNYQRANGPFADGSGGSTPITHSETRGVPGFTGTDACPDRMTAAGFVFDDRQGYGCGEVISALSDSSGFQAAEELIAAVYHRFIILQPSFREAGAGSAQTRDGRYTIFTENFAVRGSFTALGGGNVAVYPFNGQTSVPTSFDHSTESPDPLPPSSFPQYVNVAVGYPVSVHADLDQRIDVSSFTLRKKSDGAVQRSRLLSVATDAETQAFSAAIVPFQQLSPGTVYAADFSGTVCSLNWDNGQCASAPVPVTRSWSFTTR